MPVLQPSQRLGEFQIVRLLGKGGMGQVYEAEQANPARSVALKVLAPWLAEDDDALQRFWREAAVPARLDHPGIVRIIATGKTDEGTAYYVMHLVRGVSLADLIRRSREPLLETAAEVPTDEQATAARGPGAVVWPAGETPPAALGAYRADRYRFSARLGSVAARALAHAHQQGFLHRDIKPSNLMIDHHEQLYLVDFGLTRALGPHAVGSQAGVIRGTPWYMSPEQARGETVDERSDIYSLGVTLYELVTRGEGPFTASRENSSAVLVQVRAGQGLPVRSLAPDVPPKLERIIQRAMHYRPERRYPSAATLAADLEEFATEVPSTLNRNRSRGTVMTRVPRNAWLGGAAVLGLVLGTGAYLHFQPPELAQPSPVASSQGSARQTTPQPVSLKDLFDRNRPLEVRTPLLRADQQPIQSHLLWGAGSYLPLSGNELVVHSPPDNSPTVIALDYLDGSSFEFSIELRQGDIRAKNENDLGVAFGWPDAAAESSAVVRAFMAHLDERPVLKDLHGRVTLGTGQWTVRKGARGAVGQLLAPLPQGRGLLALSKPRSGPGGWHKLAVRVTQNRIRVIVDEGAAEEFDTAWLLKTDRMLKNAVLDPRGALGIWVRNGTGYFRNATIMALPDRP